MGKYIDRLQFITQDNIAGKTHVDLVRQACEAGIKWVQLRLKKETEEEQLQITLESKTLCQKYGVQLILNDHVELAKEVGVDGIHLGTTDMPIPEARAILGGNLIYGGSSNNLEDIKRLAKWKADYIGLGPLRFTTTKDDLNPVIGFEGYRETLLKMKKLGINIPLVAIGGIKADDIQQLLKDHVYGIALASGISAASNFKDAYLAFQHEIKKAL